MKEAAKHVFARMQGAVLAGTFDKRGERPSVGTFVPLAECLTQYRQTYVEQYGLTSNSLKAVLGVFEREFGGEPLARLAENPLMIEKWLQELQEQQAAKRWSNATFNRYYETGRAIFNWARKRKLVTENPFLAFERKPETTERDTRITADQERRLLDTCRDEPSPPTRSKLTAEEVAQIRRRVSDGERQIDVAEAVRVSPATVSQIVAATLGTSGQAPSARKCDAG